MRKNPYDRILKEELKKQHLSTVPKFYSFDNFFIFRIKMVLKFV